MCRVLSYNMAGQKERTHVREQEPEPAGFYENFLEYLKIIRDRTELPHVTKSSDVPWQVGRNGKSKYYSTPLKPDAVLPDRLVFRKTIEDRNGRHTHQGSLVILGLKGSGETLVDDVRHPWGPEDLIILPIKPGGIEHQHFNMRGPDDPAEWIAFIHVPYLEELGAELTQNEVYKEWQEKHSHMMSADNFEEYDDHYDLFLDFDYADWADYPPPETTNSLYDDLVVLRNNYRKMVAQAQGAGNWAVIRGEDLEYEINPQGKMKWYLHPSFEDRSMRSLLFYIQEIPPGSRSGKQHRQGGLVHYIMGGKGHTIIDGARYPDGPKRLEWEAEDYMAIPLSPEGCQFQHFNDDPENPAKIVVTEPSHGYELGWLDLGCGFEQLENCPEYDALDDSEKSTAI